MSGETKEINLTQQMSTWRDVLAPFCMRPQDFPAQVLRYNEHYVCIKDCYPKVRSKNLCYGELPPHLVP